MSGDPDDEEIPYIGVSYSDLRDMEYDALRERIRAGLAPHLDRVDLMGRGELERLRDDVKHTRKYKFRFAHDRTGDIGRDRIQLALAGLAGLFRRAGDRMDPIRGAGAGGGGGPAAGSAGRRGGGRRGELV